MRQLEWSVSINPESTADWHYPLTFSVEERVYNATVYFWGEALHYGKVIASKQCGTQTEAKAWCQSWFDTDCRQMAARLRNAGWKVEDPE